MTAAGLSLAAALVGLAPASPAGADTQSAAAYYSCTGGLVPIVQLPLQTSAPPAVPEDGAALVEASMGFAPLAALASPSATVVKVELTFDLEDPVGDINLQFTPASIKARDWDARGGLQVMVTFQSEYPVPVAQAQLPVVTQVFTFDPGSTGKRASWRQYRTVAVTFDDGGTQTVVTCQAQDPRLSLVSTAITSPTAPHETVVPAGLAPIRASAGQTVGLPPGYDPAPSPPPPTTTTTSTTIVAESPGSTQAIAATSTPGTSATAPGTTPAVGSGPANGPAEAAAGPAPVEPAGMAWPWAIIALGLAAAAAVVVIMVRGHRPGGLSPDGS